jgi:glycosyltransferase 2 family protein
VSKQVFAAKVLVTLGLLLAVFASVEPSDLRAVLFQADPALLLVATLLYAMTFVVGGIRWRAINAALGYDTTLGFCVRIFFVSGFFSQFVVGGGYGGDVYRIWVLAKRTKSKLKSFVTVFIDRASGLMGAVLAVACLAPVYWLAFPAHATLLLGISLTCAVVLALVIFLAWVGKHRTVPGAARAKSKAVRARLFEVSRDLAAGFLSWPSTVIHLGWSLVALALNMLAIAAIGDAIGLDLGLATYLSLGPIVFLAKSFPLSVAGWGAREIAMIYFFGFAGVDAGSAFAMSLLAGALVLAASSVGGVFWLASGGRVPPKDK